MMKHISFLIPSLEPGGAEAVTVELANGFSQCGFSVHVVLFQAKGSFLSRLSKQVTVVDLNARHYAHAELKLLCYLYTYKPQVVLSTIMISDLLLLLIKPLLFFQPKPKMAVRVGTTISKLPRTRLKKSLEYFLINFAYPKADVIIANSHGVAQDLRSYAHVSYKPINVIYNPVITPHFLSQIEEDPDHPWFKESFPIIMGVGRLEKEKNFSTLLEAFAVLRKNVLTQDDSTPRLMILGEGSERPKLEQLASSLGISEWVSLPGFVPNPAAYLKRCRVFVLSSIFEGLPGVLIQALACGCAVVSTDCPHGPREILDNGKYGTLVPVGDVQALAEAMANALQEKTHDHSLQNWLRQFELDTALDKYIKLLFGESN